MMKATLLFSLLLLPACSSITCNFTGDHNTLTIEQPKTISTTPSFKASGNTVPVSAIP